MLERIYGQISYDDLGFFWIRIKKFKLPPGYNKVYSSLLIRTPGGKIKNYKDYRFYLDKNLGRTADRATDCIYNPPEFDDLRAKGWARLPLVIKNPDSTSEPVSGGCLVNICQTVYKVLSQYQ
jgi:hypothetical protein